MSKGNLFLGFGRGKVGDVVFSRQNGEQVTRARNRSPRNPKSPLQLLQRVVMKTSSAAYSLMQEICNHSFQGFSEGTECQSEFLRHNVAMFRELLADEINSGDAMEILTSNKTNYSTSTMSDCPINPYIISDGTITPLSVTAQGSGTGMDATTTWDMVVNFLNSWPTGVTPATVTYQQIVDALGLQEGDQLTIVIITIDDTGNAPVQSVAASFKYQRIILEPSDGDMTSVFLTLDQASGGYKINKPNERTDFDGVIFVTDSNDAMVLVMNGVSSVNKAANSLAAGTVIVSREAGGVWRRSRNQLLVRPSDPTAAGHLDYDAETLFLGDAIQSYQTEAGSLLYLNQSQG